MVQDLVISPVVPPLAVPVLVVAAPVVLSVAAEVALEGKALEMLEVRGWRSVLT